jgi:hypothetical protein
VGRFLIGREYVADEGLQALARRCPNPQNSIRDIIITYQKAKWKRTGKNKLPVRINVYLAKS